MTGRRLSCGSAHDCWAVPRPRDSLPPAPAHLFTFRASSGTSSSLLLSAAKKQAGRQAQTRSSWEQMHAGGRCTANTCGPGQAHHMSRHSLRPQKRHHQRQLTSSIQATVLKSAVFRRRRLLGHRPRCCRRLFLCRWPRLGLGLLKVFPAVLPLLLCTCGAGSSSWRAVAERTGADELAGWRLV
jgi:hypothetical protein